MDLGLLTTCLPSWSLTEVAGWASAHGFDALEIAAWPPSGPAADQACHLDVTSPEAVDGAGQLLASRGLRCSSLAFYGNLLAADDAQRQATADHLAACIEAAGRLGVPTVGTFVGRHPGRTVAEDLRTAERLLPSFVDLAGQHGVRLVVENCPMPVWHPDGYPGNLAYAPQLWGWLADLGLALNFDPSHLPGLGIDPLAAVRPYLDAVVHAQAKDVEVFPERRDRTGWPGPLPVPDQAPGWWRYRLPGLGEVDWVRLVDLLHEGGVTTTLSIEHEDPVWSGDDARVTAGLELAHRALRPLVSPGAAGAGRNAVSP